MKHQNLFYGLLLFGLFIGFSAGMVLAIVAFTNYADTEYFISRIMMAMAGIFLFGLMFGGFLMALRHRKETMLTDTERTRQWKKLDPGFRNTWAFLMNLTTLFFATAAEMTIIVMILYREWSIGIWLFAYISFIVNDIKNRSEHPEQFIQVYKNKEEYEKSLKPPFWKRLYRHILWSPAAFLYALRAFFSKPKRVTRRFLFVLLYNAFKSDRGCYTYYTIEECMKRNNVKIKPKK